MNRIFCTVFAFIALAWSQAATAMANYDESSKIYITPQQLWISPQNIFVAVGQEAPIAIEGVYCDEAGIYIYLPSPQMVARNCPRHNQTCMICYGCSAISCMYKCPNPNQCDNRDNKDNDKKRRGR